MVKNNKLFFFELKICSKITAKKLVRKRGPCHSNFNPSHSHPMFKIN
jgi:hypothetical protein